MEWKNLITFYIAAARKASKIQPWMGIWTLTFAMWVQYSTSWAVRPTGSRSLCVDYKSIDVVIGDDNTRMCIWIPHCISNTNLKLPLSILNIPYCISNTNLKYSCIIITYLYIYGLIIDPKHLAPSRPESSTGGALHWHCRGQGLNPHSVHSPLFKQLGSQYNFVQLLLW